MMADRPIFVIPADQGVPGPCHPPLPPSGHPLPEPPTPADSHVPIAARITDNEAHRLSEGGKSFFRRMLNSTVKHA
jgi:hypothetical protein